MSLTWSLDKADGVYAPGAQATLTVTSNKRISTATIAITTGGEGASPTGPVGTTAPTRRSA